MQPGGKRERGEEDLAALARELREELACSLVPTSAIRMGEFEAEAANEPGRQVRAQVYQVEIEGTALPQAEIEEIAWIDPSNADGMTLAPLTRNEILPRIGRQALRPS
jgi:8-oxo-dGTP diphosphatase